MSKFLARIEQIEVKYEGLREESDIEYERQVKELKGRYEAGEISKGEYERLRKKIDLEEAQRWRKIGKEQEKEIWEAIYDWMKYDAEVGDEAGYDIHYFCRIEYEKLGKDYKVYDWRVVDDEEGILKRQGWCIYKIKTGELLAVYNLAQFLAEEQQI